MESEGKGNNGGRVGRNLREKARVDYTATTGTNSTPGWLKNRSISKAKLSPGQKENQQPKGQDTEKVQRTSRLNPKAGVLRSAKKAPKETDKPHVLAKAKNARSTVLKEKSKKNNASKSNAKSPQPENLKTTAEPADDPENTEKAPTRRTRSSAKTPSKDTGRESDSKDLHAQHKLESKEKEQPSEETVAQTRSRKRQTTDTQKSDNEQERQKKKPREEERRQGKNIAPSEAKSIQDELNPASLGNSKRGKAAAGLKVNKKNTKGKKWGKTTAEPQKQAENITTGTTSESADQIEAQDVGGDEDTQAQKVIEGVQEPEPHQNVGVIDGTFAPTLAPNEGRRNAAQETDVAIERSPAARAQVHDQGKTFLELLAEYTALQQKYEELKAGHIFDMENAITDVRSQEQAHTKKAQQLALHWEAEAQRQAAIAQAGDVVHLQEQVEGLKNELSQLETALVDCEAQVLEKDEEIAQLQSRLASLISLVETYQETLPASPLPEGIENGSMPKNTPMTNHSQRPAQLAKMKSILERVTNSSGHLAHTPNLHTQFSAARSSHALRPHSLLNSIALPSKAHTVTAQPLSSQPGRAESARTPLVPYSMISQAPNTSQGAILHKQLESGSKSISFRPQIELNTVTKTGNAGHLAKSLPSNQPEQGNEEALNSASQIVRRGLLSTYQSVQGTPSGQHEAIQGRQLSFLPRNTPHTVPSNFENGISNSAGLINNQEDSQGVAVEMPSEMQAAYDQSVEAEEGDAEIENMDPNDLNLTINSGFTAPSSLKSSKALSDITNKGLMNLVGLKINGAQKNGGFSYSHPPTGFAFEIRDNDSEAENDKDSLVFNPLHFGSAETLLPAYLKYQIKFAPDMRLKLVSKLMSHLGQEMLTTA